MRPAAQDAGASPSSLTAEQAAQPLAKIGDSVLTLGDFAAALETMDQFDRLRYQSPERRKELLDEMISVEILAREAREKGYDKDPQTQQEVRAILRDAMLEQVRKGAVTPAEIPESDARAYYESHRGDYRDPERRRVSAIVMTTESAANAVLHTLGTNISAVAWGEQVRSQSTDPQARAKDVPVDLAGDLGIASPPGDPRGDNPRIPEAVRAALFTIAEVGAVNPEPVAAGGKFYIVRLTQKLAPHDRTFEEAQRSIRVRLAQDRLREREQALLTELRKTIPVEVDESALATLRLGDGGAR